ncbi:MULTISPECIES: sigma-70 family RNA polymerase sigma factor [unclassified Pseudofrankia]|uniref:sigma-70 family RNA polymerase sigma factor n=1 Tax=unclassified Pseudofrankia TaxID=2994372 RepID=UPI0008D8DD41|nr:MULTISPECIES: sigma-70 family RNA polymerase sigma factor [unclassified Pseudofrankia]MDT3439513.1 sigma-70 family RNA polymerase sigma factor [Pseudofrankia sp. BMG5.37]OHV48700.1 RNA polymerase subunit sigma-70 [Pseudofrankia sp. BMG5.36]
MSAELLQRARDGDRDAFADLVEPYRGELAVHCYRMLGSLQDAQDAVQETMLSAWLGLAGFEGRSSVRTWLHRIATNRCLNLLRSSTRRPTTASPLPAPPLPAPSPEPTHLGEVPWLQPYPDALLEGLPDEAPGPEAQYASREAISLAFVTAVQLLPPNQRAVLILRDVLGYRASETADLLGLTEDAVTSALRRARATMDAARSPGPPPPVPRSPEERALLDRFVAAFTDLDVDALVALMTDDAWVRMPPLPFEYRGREAIRQFFTAVRSRLRRIDRLVPVRANGQPAWGEYLRDPVTGGLHLAGIIVIDVAGDLVREITRFETTVAPHFGLPRTLD